MGGDIQRKIKQIEREILNESQTHRKKGKQEREGLKIDSVDKKRQSKIYRNKRIIENLAKIENERDRQKETERQGQRERDREREK